MMKLTGSIALTLLCFILFSSCDKNNRGEWHVSDVSKDTTFVANTHVKNPSTLILKVTGETDDSVKVHLIVIPGGKIDKELRVDHYYSSIRVKYDSYKAKRGKIKIEYHLP